MNTDWAHLDLQMRAYLSFFRDKFRIAAPQNNSIATSMAQEIRNLDKKVHISDEVGIQSRLDELVAFQKMMDIVHSSQVHPAVIRAQVIVNNYLCFVYLGDSVFKVLRTEMPNESVTSKCCKFLTDNPVRAFRNALAHANWKYKEDFSGLIYWAKKGDQKDEPLTEWQVSQNQLDLWQALARCTGYVVFTELQEMNKGRTKD
jgi:hypothetical protein